MSVRTGLGIDSHAFVAGRPLILGGVDIPNEVGLAGHSDADVLTHAVADALLGAAALGDIGLHYPDSDPRWEGADSLDLLRSVVVMVEQREYAIENVDCTLVMERPKIGPYREQMRDLLAQALGIAPLRVNVKATTGEGLGFVGRSEGAAALAIATLSFVDA
jgi:2-C-methyl-D-erythritol 2,4-cyclodiphosphate synthase